MSKQSNSIFNIECAIHNLQSEKFVLLSEVGYEAGEMIDQLVGMCRDRINELSVAAEHADGQEENL